MNPATTLATDLYTFDGRAIRKKFASLGFKKFESVVVPKGWSPEYDEDPNKVTLLAANVARFLGCRVVDVLTEAPLPPPPPQDTRFFRARDSSRMNLSVHLAREVAGAVARARRAGVEVRLPLDATSWRRDLLSSGNPPTLRTVIEDLWSRGVVVVHLPKLPVGKPLGMAFRAEGYPVIVLTKNTSNEAELVFIAAHETAHHALGHCDDQVVVDMEGGSSEDDERAADEWATRTLIGNASLPFELSWDEQDHARGGVDACVLAWIWALQSGFPDAFMKANARIKAWSDPSSKARDVFAEVRRRHLDETEVSKSDVRLLALLG